MPDQPADPIHYDMKIPPQPKHPDEESQSAKKHGDKLNIESGKDSTDARRDEERPGQSSER